MSLHPEGTLIATGLENGIVKIFEVK